MPAPHEKIVMGYAETTAISPRACLDVQAACKRFLADLQDSRWDFRTDMAESIIEIIETLFCHQQGEDLSGRPMRGKPLILEPFQLFIIYNLCGFFLPDTDIRRYQEAMWMLARKNGKTPFATAFCWAMGLWYSKSFSKIKTVAGSMNLDYSASGTAKLTVLCDVDTGEKDDDGEPIVSRQRSTWYLAEDGAVSQTVPARRASGTWDTISVKKLEEVETKVIETFAKNKTNHKLEFWSTLDLNVQDNCTFYAYGEILRSYISYKRKSSEDSRYYYKSGELATTATEKLRGVIK